MKITRRSDAGKGDHLLISVPARRVTEVEAALIFLEGKRQQRGSHVVIESDRPSGDVQWLETDRS